MDTGATSPRWGTAQYAAQLRTWVEDELGPVTMTRTKLRAWSTVWKVEAAGGRYWAKQNCPLQAFEGRLTALLAGLVRDRVLTPVAVRDDGRLLLPDGGPVLREVDGAADDLAAWCRVVGEWARLQLALVEHTDAISATGVTTLDPETLPAWVRDRAEVLRALDPTDPRHLDDNRWTSLLEAGPEIEEAAAEVAGLGLPLALNHNDLHAGNAFVAEEGSPLRFFDLADAVLTDPMAVLVIPLGQLPDDSRARGAVARAWIDVWREYADEAALWRVLPAALRLGVCSRHESWSRVMSAMTEQELAEWGPAAPYWLARVGDAPPDVVALG